MAQAAPLTSRWLILGSLAIAVFMSTLDASIVNVALATISRDFGIQVDTLQWIVITYALALVALLPIAGRASDILGRTRIFTWGFVAFIAGSVLCSLAWNLASLAFFRIIQGVGAAMLQGNSGAIVTAAFPPSERGRAFGAIGATVSAGIIAGPVLGGLLTAWLGWRSVFWVNAPVALAGFLMGRAFLPRDQAADHRTFDFPGAILFAVGAIAFMSGLSAAARAPWVSFRVGGAMLAGALLLVAFALWERRAPAPLIPPAIFSSPGVAAGLGSALISFTAGFMSVFVTPYVMQSALGFSIRATGLVMTASPLAMIVCSPVSGYLSDRYGGRTFTLAGMLTVGTGLYLLSWAGPGWQPQDFAWRLLILGMGWGLFNSPNTAMVMSAVPPQVAGVTSGLNATARNIATTIAVAAAATLFTWASGGAATPAAYLAGHRTTLLVAALVAAAGLLPAFLRAVPAGAGRPARPAG